MMEKPASQETSLSKPKPDRHDALPNALLPNSAPTDALLSNTLPTSEVFASEDKVAHVASHESRQTGECRVVVRLSALGDVVLVTGVLLSWHVRYAWRFVVITRAAWAELFIGHPAVDRVIGLSDAELSGSRMLTRWQELAAQYAGVELIDLHGNVRTRLLGLYWRGPLRRYAKQALARRLFLLSRGRVGSANLRALRVTQRYALAVDAERTDAALLLPRLYLTAEELAQGQAVLAQLVACTAGKNPKQPIIALHPYAAHAGKTWAPARWLELAAALERHKLAWCVIGRGPELPGLAPERSLVNRLGVRESAAVLAGCARLVTGDSGPMHLAAAVATPVVALFGSTTREWGFYPAGPHDVVLERELPCRPCALHGARHCPRAYACLDFSPSMIAGMIAQSVNTL